MARRKMATVVGALGAASLLLAGCSGSGVNAETLNPPASTAFSLQPTSGPTASRAPSVEPSATPTAGTSPSTGSSSSGGASPSAATSSEATNRAAVEAQWIKSWNVYADLPATPSSQRKALASKVMVDPALTGAIKDAESITGKGLDTYGQVGHRITWPKPINGSDMALVNDCMDTSKSGAYETASGNKTSVGVARLHMQGSLIKGADGIWRVQQTYFLKDEPC